MFYCTMLSGCTKEPPAVATPLIISLWFNLYPHGLVMSLMNFKQLISVNEVRNQILPLNMNKSVDSWDLQ